MADKMTVPELRMLISEKIPATGTEEDTNFGDDDLQSVIDRYDDFGNNRILAEAWALKAGVLAELIDINENGSDRKMSQMFKNAKAMADRYDKIATADEESTAKGRRAVGLGFDAFTCEETADISLFSDGDEVRSYPLKRFFQIKQ